ncbi:MAG: hypothetical protein JW864_13190 [Spirochaetes bacterium]|nr:hypothetical protein [Spirochaetota bacterium]
MKFRLLSFIAAVAAAVFFATNASAQYMTQDLIFVKAGYIPVYTVSYEQEGNDDSEISGFAIQGEYNLNFDGFWLGFGLEYQYMNDDADGEDVNHSFILPMASIKVAAVGGLYVGAGLAGKYLITTGEYEGGVEATKEIDLWANGILGYYMPIGEGVFLDLEGRFGWNITNRQFSEYEMGGNTYESDVENSYDIGFYVGVGFRAPGSNY